MARRGMLLVVPRPSSVSLSPRSSFVAPVGSRRSSTPSSTSPRSRPRAGSAHSCATTRSSGRRALMGTDLAGYVHDPDLGWDTPNHVRGVRRYAAGQGGRRVSRGGRRRFLHVRRRGRRRRDLPEAPGGAPGTGRGDQHRGTGIRHRPDRPEVSDAWSRLPPGSAGRRDLHPRLLAHAPHVLPLRQASLRHPPEHGRPGADPHAGPSTGPGVRGAQARAGALLLHVRPPAPGIPGGVRRRARLRALLRHVGSPGQGNPGSARRGGERGPDPGAVRPHRARPGAGQR